LVIIFDYEVYDKYRSRITRCISEGLCEEDQGIPTFLRDMKHGWEKLWEKESKIVMQLAERKERIVNGNEVTLSVQAIECEENHNSDLETVTGSETHAEDQTEQSWTGASSVQRALTTDSTAERVQEAQVYDSDQNEGLYME
jgi:hypothetical protein